MVRKFSFYYVIGRKYLNLNSNVSLYRLSEGTLYQLLSDLRGFPTLPLCASDNRNIAKSG